MLMRNLFVTGAILSAGCVNRSSTFVEPVGETQRAATSKPSPDRDRASARATADDGAGERAVNDVDSYLTGKGAGPCGTTPPIIAFEGSSTALAEPQMAELRSLSDCLTAAPYETATVVLVGYTDVIGTFPANLELGLARAQVVMRQLMSGGVTPGRIVVASAGELQRPRAHWGLHAHRVEILIARGGPPRPDEVPIARGIEAQGLMPRRGPPAGAAAPSAAPPPRPAARPAVPAPARPR